MDSYRKTFPWILYLLTISTKLTHKKHSVFKQVNLIRMKNVFHTFPSWLIMHPDVTDSAQWWRPTLMDYIFIYLSPVIMVLPERLLGDMRTGEMEGVRDEEYGLCRSLSIVEDEATKWYCDHPSCIRATSNIGTCVSEKDSGVQYTNLCKGNIEFSQCFCYLLWIKISKYNNHELDHHSRYIFQSEATSLLIFTECRMCSALPRYNMGLRPCSDVPTKITETKRKHSTCRLLKMMEKLNTICFITLLPFSFYRFAILLIFTFWLNSMKLAIWQWKYAVTKNLAFFTVKMLSAWK